MRPASLAAFGIILGVLAACGSTPSDGPVDNGPSAGPDTGLDRMERLTLNADRCWFKSGDPVFDPYSLAPELSSFSGKPRFLIVPQGRPEAKPLLVVEGASGSGDVAVYGPLLSGPLAGRVQRDIDRWRGGSDDCA